MLTIYIKMKCSNAEQPSTKSMATTIPHKNTNEDIVIITNKYH